jgi:hypothetical protein
MSWGMIYRLPGRELPVERIEEAVRCVIATLPDVQFKTTLRTYPTGRDVLCELELLPTDLDAKVASIGSSNIADPLWVQIDFVADAEEWPPGSGSHCRFEFDTARSGNSLATGAVQEIAARLGRYFGVPGRASWEADA